MTIIVIVFLVMIGLQLMLLRKFKANTMITNLMKKIVNLLKTTHPHSGLQVQHCLHLTLNHQKFKASMMITIRMMTFSQIMNSILTQMLSACFVSVKSLVEQRIHSSILTVKQMMMKINPQRVKVTLTGVTLPFLKTMMKKTLHLSHQLRTAQSVLVRLLVDNEILPE